MAGTRKARVPMAEQIRLSLCILWFFVACE